MPSTQEAVASHGLCSTSICLTRTQVKLALILCIQNEVGVFQEPTPEALAVSLKLVDKELGFYIIWITNQSLDISLQGFPPKQDNLIGAIQAWLDKLI